MANTTTLADLRATALRKSDNENASFISTAEANGYVNEVICELHDLLVTEFQDYFKSSSTVTLAAGTEAYSLPTDFYKLLGIFYVVGSVRYVLDQFMLGELGEYEADRYVPTSTGEHLRYRIVGNQIVFTPKPSGAGTVEVWYVPQATKLTDDADVVSYAVVNGWEEYVTNGAAIKMLQKGERDAAYLVMRQQQLENRIRAAARARNAAHPQRVTDVYADRRRRRGYRRC